MARRSAFLVAATICAGVMAVAPRSVAHAGVAPGLSVAVPLKVLCGQAAAALLFEAAPIETRLGSGATGLMRSLRVGIRKTTKTIMAALRRWRDWIPLVLLFSAMCLAPPLFDRSLLRAWDERGLSAVRQALSLGVAVYVRLLLDRRSPLIGKLLLVFAVIYGVASRDLLPDSRPLGLLDDVVLVTLASRSFLRLCPDRLIEEHAARATRGRLRRQSQIRPTPPLQNSDADR